MNEMPGIETTIIDLTEIVGSVECPCDYDRLLACGPAAAKWVMVVRCGCGVVSHRLACVTCKDTLMRVEDALACECGEVFQPARKAFTFIEKI